MTHDDSPHMTFSSQEATFSHLTILFMQPSDKDQSVSQVCQSALEYVIEAVSDERRFTQSAVEIFKSLSKRLPVVDLDGDNTSITKQHNVRLFRFS
jgi:deoxyribose-phosphate aldolase